MGKRVGGSRRKSRHKFSKSISKKGKISIKNYLQKFKKGEKVVLIAEPAIHKGLYFRRFHGKVGIVEKERGSCYELSIKDGNKLKTLIVHPIHLKNVRHINIK